MRHKSCWRPGSSVAFQHLKWAQASPYRQTESSSKPVFSAFSSKPSHAGPCHEMHWHAELRMPGWAGCWHAALGTSHGDVDTRSCVPLPALMPLTAPLALKRDTAGWLGKGCFLQMLLKQRAHTVLTRIPRVVCHPLLCERHFSGSMKGWTLVWLHFCMFTFGEASALSGMMQICLPACRSALEAAVGAHSALSLQDALDVHVFKVQSQAPAGSKGHLCS